MILLYIMKRDDIYGGWAAGFLSVESFQPFNMASKKRHQIEASLNYLLFLLYCCVNLIIILILNIFFEIKQFYPFLPIYLLLFDELFFSDFFLSM